MSEQVKKASLYKKALDPAVTAALIGAAGGGGLSYLGS